MSKERQDQADDCLTALLVTHVDGTVERFPVTGTIRIQRPGEREEAEAPSS